MSDQKLVFLNQFVEQTKNDLYSKFQEFSRNEGLAPSTNLKSKFQEQFKNFFYHFHHKFENLFRTYDNETKKKKIRFTRFVIQ